MAAPLQRTSGSERQAFGSFLALTCHALSLLEDEWNNSAEHECLYPMTPTFSELGAGFEFWL